jgi:enediyne biosynthesis protein E4
LKDSNFLTRLDPRYVILALLVSYLVLGSYVLGFNRTPTQMLLTFVSAGLIEMLLCRFFSKQWIFPLSAFITACGLSILLDYAHSHVLLLIPVLAAIGSKYVFRLNGRHFFNPALFGVVFSLFFSKDLISAAPAYQWYGMSSMTFFLGFFAVTLFMPQINRWRLVLAFLLTFTLQTALRAWIMRHHLPFETLFWGTLSSPPFLLFTFYMITDPATSPKDNRTQIWVGVSIALLDLVFHIFKSYYTFFYAAFAVAALRFVWLHAKKFRTESLASLKLRLSKHMAKPALVGIFTVVVFAIIQIQVPLVTADSSTELRFEEVSASKTGIDPEVGDLYARLDPRVQHVAKWLIGIGDSVASADIDGDGLQDLFFTFPLKSDLDRCSFYLNNGDFKFTRVTLREATGLQECETPETYGIPTYALFHDIDNDGKPDLFIFRAFGSPLALRNISAPGQIQFEDISAKLGLDSLFRSTIGAVFLDINKNGRADLFLANVIPEFLPGYPDPAPRLNLFDLPEAAHEGDRRMFNFMHHSWHNAQNGGTNDLFLQDENGRFVRQDTDEWNMPETHWSLSVASTDFNQDGWPDLYVANDFGPDDLYYNKQGQGFERIQGTHFGSIGRDTYKGMNASIGDINRNGWMDVYISNVHHDLQAEGSLLWMFKVNPADHFRPLIESRAMREGALNERRFGWGAQFGDLTNNGWLDIVQANGMVDDLIDKRHEKCPDYWYVNEKVARSPPSIHSYADMWGDIRGMCIHGNELNRVYLNRGEKAYPRFVDVAEKSGVDYRGNSRGAALIDLNNNGKLDIVFTHQFHGPTLYRNSSSLDESRRFLNLTLDAGDSGDCPRSALGSKVSVLNQDLPLIREVTSSHGFAAQGDSRLHFGIETLEATVDLEVRWCGTQTEVFSDITLDSFVRLERGSGSLR